MRLNNRRVSHFVRVLSLLASDLVSFYLSVFFAFYTRMFASGYVLKSIPFSGQRLSNYTLLYGLPLAFVLILAFRGFYTTRRFFWDDFKEFINTAFIYVTIIITSLTLIVEMRGWSRSVLLMIPLFLIFFFPILRFLTNVLLFNFGVVEKCDFIGSKESFKKFKKVILLNKYLGFVLDKPAEYVFLDSSIENLNVHLRELTKSYRFVCLFDCNSALPSGSVKSYFNTEALNIFSFENKLFDKRRMFVKRAIDVFVVLILMPLFIPILAVVSILIVLDSKGPIFFVQERVGKDGKIFRCYKFRTMFVDAEKRLLEILNKDLIAKEQWLQNSKLRNDPRVTNVGKLLRRFSIDELPQIINVLKGDMSFVGPRPITIDERDLHYKDHLRYYYSVKPGVTGLAQVSGRSLLSFQERIEFDRWYIENWSLWLDLIIILKTIIVVLRKEGAI